MMQVSLLAAYRAVALGRTRKIGGDLESDSAAVTAAVVGLNRHQLLPSSSARRVPSGAVHRKKGDVRRPGGCQPRSRAMDPVSVRSDSLVERSEFELPVPVSKRSYDSIMLG